MDFIMILLLAGATFGLCFLVDKLFQRLFRSRAIYRSGKSVRLSKKYGSVGVIIGVLGIAGIFSGIREGWFLILGGSLLILVGLGLIVYYLTFGIYYDEQGFLYCAFGKKQAHYTYGQIRHQQLYMLQGGSALVELHMEKGAAVPVQLSLAGAEDFLNTAFSGWVAQNGIQDTPFHDPANSCWFPSQEVE